MTMKDRLKWEIEKEREIKKMAKNQAKCLALLLFALGKELEIEIAYEMRKEEKMQKMERKQN